MRLLVLAAAFALPLAACGSKDEDTATVTVDTGKDGEKALVSVGGETGLKIDAEGFKASVDIPGMNLGGKGFDIDGMKLYPGSAVKGMKVVAKKQDGEDRGTVTVTFTSPAAPEAVLTHAAEQADKEGYAATRNGLTLRGEKNGEDSFVYTVAAAGAGTAGTLVMTDTK